MKTEPLDLNDVPNDERKVELDELLESERELKVLLNRENCFFLPKSEFEQDVMSSSDRKFNQKSVLNETKCRIKRGANKRTHECPICKCQVFGLLNYNRHMKQMHHTRAIFKLTTFECPICKMILCGRYKLDYHLKTIHHTSHDEMSPFKCSQCSRTFQRLANLQRHEKETHTRCKISTKVGNLKRNLHKIKRSSGNDNFSFSCSQCNRKFLSFHLLKHHRLIFHCSASVSNDHKRRFRKDSHYVESKTIENSSKVKIVYADKLCCSYCPKFLSNSVSKCLHEKIHTGVRPYSCKHCEASFRLKRTLADHEKKCLSLVNVLWCHFCDFSHVSMINLKLHYLNTHGLDCNLNNNSMLLSKGPLIFGSKELNSSSNNHVNIGNENYETDSLLENFPDVRKERRSTTIPENNQDLMKSNFIVIDD